MKLIYVRGAGDYAAMLFADGADISVKEAYERAVANGGTFEYEVEDDIARITAYEFGKVDPKFIDFLRRHIIDYDHSKAHDFFIVKEDE